MDGPDEVFWFAFAVGTISGLVFSLLALVFVMPVWVNNNNNNHLFAMGRISLYISVLMLLCSCVYDYEPKDSQTPWRRFTSQDYWNSAVPGNGAVCEIAPMQLSLPA
jgi:hypothetical protein